MPSTQVQVQGKKIPAPQSSAKQTAKHEGRWLIRQLVDGVVPKQQSSTAPERAVFN